MSEVAKAVKPLFDKFIDFFDIFDLSFFVSGATFVAAIAWARLTPNLEVLLGYPSESTAAGDPSAPADGVPGVGIIVLVLASYISGMTCFAIGRFIRKWLYKAVDEIQRRRGKRAPSVLFAELAQHGVIERRADNDGWEVTVHGHKLKWLPRYFADGGRGQESALYVRMWAEVRQREIFAPSFSLLRRYWVSSATLDGLFVALITWGALLWVVQRPEHGWLPTLATFGGAAFCLREARRYGEYQREELIATLLLAYDMPDIEVASATAPTAAPSAAASAAADAPAVAPAGAGSAPTSGASAPPA
jgi:hypothetical protein